MTEMKPCPMCNGEAVLIPRAMPKSIRFAVHCEWDGCGVHTASYATEAEALAAWNTRPAPTDADVQRVVLVQWLAMAVAEMSRARGRLETLATCNEDRRIAAALGRTCDCAREAMKGQYPAAMGGSDGTD
jgi:hypothetical protein